MLEEEAADLELDSASYDPPLELVGPDTDAGADCEIAVVVGGDGSILRAAEVTWSSGTPVLGVNLGHVGFLAEAEPDDVEATIEAIVQRTWTPEDRLTLDVRAYRDGELVTHTFALNEASVEKAARERMIEVVIEIDNRPLSRWGCDGVVLSTPTGSTAYNFSAGGPVVWPGVEALVVVPISAHALFARPMVVAPDSMVAVEVIARTDGSGVLWCDGRRPVDLPPGARIEVRRGERPVRLARLHRAPFTDRLVAKFDLPVDGLARLRRAPAPRRGRRWRRTVLEEIRISQLGVIDSSTLELGPGPDGDHRRDRCRQDHGRHRARPAAGCPRGLAARCAAAPEPPGSRASWTRRALGGFAEAVDEAGGEIEDGRVVLARNLSAEGRSRAFVGGASVPVTQARRGDRGRSSRCTASPTSTGSSSSGPSARRSTGSAASRWTPCWRRTPTSTAASRPPSASSTRSSTSARERAREADLLRFGLGEVEAVGPVSQGGRGRWRPRSRRLGFADALRTAAESARESLSGEDGAADALSTTSAARTLLDGVREHDAEAGELADRLAEITYLLSDVAADVASYASRLETDPARLAAVSERRAALTALTRKYGDTIDDVLAWAQASAARLLDLDGTDERIEALRAELEQLGGRARRRGGGPVVRARRGGGPARRPGHRRARAARHAGRHLRHLGHQDRVHRPPASTTSSSCSPPTSAPARGRCTRAPREVSCPG